MNNILKILILFSIKSINAFSLQTIPYDNFTRYILESEDFIVRNGDLYNNYWHLDRYSAYKSTRSGGCILTTKPLYIVGNFSLTAQILYKAEADIALRNINLFNVIPFFKMNLSIEDNKVNETIFYLSELKDVETIASVGETFYMNAKTKNDKFIYSHINFNMNKTYQQGEMKICISNIIMDSELYIKNIVLDVIQK